MARQPFSFTTRWRFAVGAGFAAPLDYPVTMVLVVALEAASTSLAPSWFREWGRALIDPSSDRAVPLALILASEHADALGFALAGIAWVFAIAVYARLSLASVRETGETAAEALMPLTERLPRLLPIAAALGIALAAARFAGMIGGPLSVGAPADLAQPVAISLIALLGAPLVIATVAAVAIDNDRRRGIDDACRAAVAVFAVALAATLAIGILGFVVQLLLGSITVAVFSALQTDPRAAFHIVTVFAGGFFGMIVAAAVAASVVAHYRHVHGSFMDGELDRVIEEFS